MKIYNYEINLYRTDDRNDQYLVFNDFGALYYWDYTMYMDEIIFSKIEKMIEKIPEEEILCDNTLRFSIDITEEELFYIKLKYSDKFDITIT